MNQINRVGIDKDGVYWRTRRKQTPGWTVAANLKTSGPTVVNYVIEMKKLVLGGQTKFYQTYQGSRK